MRYPVMPERTVKPGEGEGVYVAGVSGVRHLLMCVTFYIIFA